MLTRRVLSSALFAVSTVALPGIAQAQVSITALAGGYIPGSSIGNVSSDAQNVAKTRDGTLSLGLDLDFGPLRGSAAYASGTTIKNANRQAIGKGNVASVAADLVIRPLPRIFVQPYLIAGAGQKFTKLDQSATLTASDASQKSFALHGGLGADLMLGSFGIAAELTDFVSKDVADKWNVHDGFLMVGIKLPLGR